VSITLIALILLILMSFLLLMGIWIPAGVAITAWFGLAFFSDKDTMLNLANVWWNSSSSYTLASLPLFVWMGEILFRTKLSEQMFTGLSPWLNWLPGRLMHVNILGCGIFGSVSGSSAATCATIAKSALPELTKRGYDEKITLGSLSCAGTLGILIPPSITMVVYAVAADQSIIRIFLAGRDNPIDDNAALTLSLDSAMVLSASPTIVKAAIPKARLTCTSTSIISMPLKVKLGI